MSMQVLAILAGAAIAVTSGWLVGGWAHRALYRMSMFGRIPVRDRTALGLHGPIRAFVVVIAWDIAISLFAFDGDVLAVLRAAGTIGLLVALAWTAMRLVDAGIESVAMRSQWISGHRVSQALLPAGRTAARIAIALLACVMVLATLGYATGALVAALVIVGLAAALGAQKTLDNLFGAFAIGVDTPFKEGDFIKLSDGTMGTVEDIGLRSTRIRTLDRTMISIPNGRLAESQVETLTERDRVRFDVKLKVELGATTQQLEHVLDGLHDLLKAHPHRSPEPPSVHLVAIADGWFELEAMAWFRASWPEFEAIRDRLLISCLEVVSRAGVRLHAAPYPPIASAPAPRAPATQPWSVPEPS